MCAIDCAESRENIPMQALLSGGVGLAVGGVLDGLFGPKILYARAAPRAEADPRAPRLAGRQGVKISGTEVSRNEGNGIFGGMGSVVWLEDGAKITGNGGHGIAMVNTGVVGKFYVPTDISITNNGGHGISCSPSPGVAQLYGFPPTVGANAPDVSGNDQGDYGCLASPNPVWQF
jgi:hypothetical protein